MGGDNNLSGEDSSVDEDISQLSSTLLRHGGLSVGQPNSLAHLELEANKRRREKAYNEILQSFNELGVRCEGLEEAKRKILSYKPGAWVHPAGSKEPSNYDMPTTTSFILIGPKGSGKSSLVNRISKTFEDDKFASERAQVTYNSSVGDGTLFLQEYMIPRASSSFCLYDTRSLSDDFSDNIEMLKNLMTRGVHNGKLVIRESDDLSLRNRMKCKAHGSISGPIRKVNFVIFVVDGISVLRSMGHGEDTDRLYSELIVSAFNCPYLSFLDDKPVVVITHGDALSRVDRARVRVNLGELLGIPPMKQIFDIPAIEHLDQETEMAIVDMLRYSLEHADKNLPRKRQYLNGMNKIISPLSSSILLVFMLLAIAAISALVLHGNLHHHPQSLKGELNRNLHSDPQELKQNGNHHRDPEELSGNFHRDPLELNGNLYCELKELNRNLHQDPQELNSKPHSDPQELNGKPQSPSQDLNGNLYRDPDPDTLPQDEVNVEWHKIRHLWLKEDDFNVEWHKIRHLWLDD